MANIKFGTFVFAFLALVVYLSTYVVHEREMAIKFKLGEIENLPLEDNSVDVIMSNCVINLSPDKKQVFSEAYRVLKPNGKLLISDIVTEEKLPEIIVKNIQAWIGCVAGAQEKSEYLNIIKNAGFNKVNVISQSNFTLGIPKYLKIKISSIQVEAFKTDN